jgi:DNA repair exonuclease SbcCD ATPase subunit
MTALQSLVPSWLRGNENDGRDFTIGGGGGGGATRPSDGTMPPIPVAVIPQSQTLPSEASQQDEDKIIFGRAAVMLEQLKRDREDAQRREQELQIQITETLLARQADAKKIDFLELDNAELRNNIANLQAQVEEYRTFMGKLKQNFDTFGIKSKQKTPRKKRRKIEITESPPHEPMQEK